MTNAIGSSSPDLSDSKLGDGSAAPSEAPSPHRTTILIEEYKDVGANLRHYVNLRFAQLTLFVTITVAILALLFAQNTTLSNCQRLGLHVFGLYIAGMFYVLEYRSTWWRTIYFKRALQIELELDLRQYSQRGITIAEAEEIIEKGQRRGLRYLSATHATHVLLLIVIVGWVLLALGSRYACAI